MTIRKLVQDTLVGALGTGTAFGGRVFNRGSLGVAGTPPTPHRPFAIWHEGLSSSYNISEDVYNRLRPFTIHIYDSRGSYSRIEEGLQLVRLALKPLVEGAKEGNQRCIGYEWTEVSQDLTDEQYDAAVKYGRFNLTTSE